MSEVDPIVQLVMLGLLPLLKLHLIVVQEPLGCLVGCAGGNLDGDSCMSGDGPLVLLVMLRLLPLVSGPSPELSEEYPGPYWFGRVRS